MAADRLVKPHEISPAQDFLKERTVQFILQCIKNGEEDQLPPAPIVREDSEGKLVAIDGHNLIAVMYALGRVMPVHIAGSADDGLPETSEANSTRNQDLRDKFESCLVERDTVARSGILTFGDLIAKHPELFGDANVETKVS